MYLFIYLFIYLLTPAYNLLEFVSLFITFFITRYKRKLSIWSTTEYATTKDRIYATRACYHTQVKGYLFFIKGKSTDYFCYS